MGLSCGASLVKYGIFIFNLLCAVAGIALIVVGAIPLFSLGDIRDAFPENNPAIIPIIVICLGSVIFIISFFGCCGAIRESQCMVTTYTLFLLALVVGQIVIAVYAFMYTDELARAAQSGFDKLWRAMNNDAHSVETINGIQRSLQCCGLNNANDWLPNIPDSCCSAGTSCSVSNSFDIGCSQQLFDLVSASGLLIAWISIVFAGIELVGVVFSCCLANSLRNADRRQFA